jgi:hypothetical protein
MRTAKSVRIRATTTVITEGRGAAGTATVSAVPTAGLTVFLATCRTRRRARPRSCSTRTTPARVPTTTSFRRVEKQDPFKIGGVCRHVSGSKSRLRGVLKPGEQRLRRAVAVLFQLRVQAPVRDHLDLLIAVGIPFDKFCVEAQATFPRGGRRPPRVSCFRGLSGSDGVLQLLERPAPRFGDFGPHIGRQIAV